MRSERWTVSCSRHALPHPVTRGRRSLYDVRHAGMPLAVIAHTLCYCVSRPSRSNNVRRELSVSSELSRRCDGSYHHECDFLWTVGTRSNSKIQTYGPSRGLAVDGHFGCNGDAIIAAWIFASNATLAMLSLYAEEISDSGAGQKHTKQQNSSITLS